MRPVRVRDSPAQALPCYSSSNIAAVFLGEVVAVDLPVDFHEKAVSIDIERANLEKLFQNGRDLGSPQYLSRLAWIGSR